MLSDDDMRERMRNGWRMGRPFTECGNGSIPAATKNIRSWLPDLFVKYEINSVVEAGAGDLMWATDEVKPAMQSSERTRLFGAAYLGFDLFPRRPGIIECDITTQVLPRADAILCRFVLNHLDRERVDMAISNFKKSGSTYLIATQFEREKLTDKTPQFSRLDLRDFLNEQQPIEACRDGLEPACWLAMWKLQ